MGCTGDRLTLRQKLTYYASLVEKRDRTYSSHKNVIAPTTKENVIALGVHILYLKSRYLKELNGLRSLHCHITFSYSASILHTLLQGW